MSFLIRNLAFCGALLVLAACSPSPSEQAGEEPPLKTWRPFAAESPWNTPIPAKPDIDAQSKALISDFASNGSLYINIAEWSVPVYYIDMDETPKHEVLDIYPGQYGRGFEPPREIPIPDGAQSAEPKGGLGYIAIVDKARNLEWDMRQAHQRDDGRWFTGFGAITNLRGSGVSPPWNDVEQPNLAASALESGFPLTAGLIRVEEINSGRIPHALMFAYPGARTDGFISPASMAMPVAESADIAPQAGMPLGARIQLDPAFNVEGSDLSREGKIIARALQEYGAYLGESAGGNVLFAESAPTQLEAWDGTLVSGELQAVFTPEMMAKHFRLIEMGDVLPGPSAD
ncbi:hypothetical protein [Hyphomonas sp.]|uniref:hypothetical protein n=1 Tax=Hyphomonas sp. TaxID=87 RepID=UPI0030F8C8E8